MTLLIGSNKSYDRLAHHNIHFGKSWDGVFDELIKKKTLMTDPSLLVTVPTHDDKDLAPAGKNSYYVLFPTPNLSADIDWKVTGPKYRDQMLRTMEERGYDGFADSIEVEHMTFYVIEDIPIYTFFVTVNLHFLYSKLMDTI